MELRHSGHSFPVPQCKYNLYKTPLFHGVCSNILSFEWFYISSIVLCVHVFHVMLAFVEHKQMFTYLLTYYSSTDGSVTLAVLFDVYQVLRAHVSTNSDEMFATLHRRLDKIDKDNEQRYMSNLICKTSLATAADG